MLAAPTTAEKTRDYKIRKRVAAERGIPITEIPPFSLPESPRPVREIEQFVEKACANCSQPFEVDLSTAGGATRRYCSDRCKEAARKRIKEHRRRMRAAGEKVDYDAPDLSYAAVRAQEKHAEAMIAEKTERSIARLQLIVQAEANTDLLRAAATNIVVEHIEIAAKVLRGQKKWSTVQLRLFQTLLDKTLPNAQPRPRAIDSERLRAETRAKLDDMSLEDLEALLAKHIDGAQTYEPEDFHEREAEDAEPEEFGGEQDFPGAVRPGDEEP